VLPEQSVGRTVVSQQARQASGQLRRCRSCELAGPAGRLLDGEVPAGHPTGWATRHQFPSGAGSAAGRAWALYREEVSASCEVASGRPWRALSDGRTSGQTSLATNGVHVTTTCVSNLAGALRGQRYQHCGDAVAATLLDRISTGAT